MDACCTAPVANEVLVDDKSVDVVLATPNVLFVSVCAFEEVRIELELALDDDKNVLEVGSLEVDFSVSLVEDEGADAVERLDFGEVDEIVDVDECDEDEIDDAEDEVNVTLVLALEEVVNAASALEFEVEDSATPVEGEEDT